MSTLAVWVLSLILFLQPLAWRYREQARIAEAIAAASEDEEDATALVAIGYWESGFSTKARGRAGELGVWQLMPPAPAELHAQAREALRRLHVQGWRGFTGEAGGRCPWTGCPLAQHRELTAAMLAAAFAHSPDTAP